MSMRYPAGFIRPGYDPLKNPDAPTIGTATGGNALASVTFTAPSDVGGSAITAYSVVSTPGGFVGTGASSPVTVTGLTNGTAYTFKVFATNSYGPSAASAASNSTTPVAPPSVIGEAYGGGYYAGQIGVGGVATHYIIVGPVASAQSSLQWKTSATSTAGTASDIDGPANSTAMNNSSHPAAQFCEGLTVGGQTDWYMPAKNELEVCYFNLKPTTSGNDTSSGINPNAVPARASNYTNSPQVPAQTSASVFQSGNSEAFSASSYWSSTESGATTAWRQNFDGGAQLSAGGKTYSQNVRAIRRIPV
jgi:hypothetical protein